MAGCAARLLALGALPCGLNQDEAFAGYNAWALLHYGVDSSGYHNPVYFTAWGSGMNALEAILMMPFIALFGTGTAVLRLPQAPAACLSLFAVYGFGKRTFGRGFALCALAVLATSPWHVMMARWALESNLAPAFFCSSGYTVSCVAWHARASCQRGGVWIEPLCLCHYLAHCAHYHIIAGLLCGVDEKSGVGAACWTPRCCCSFGRCPFCGFSVCRWAFFLKCIPHCSVFPQNAGIPRR